MRLSLAPARDHPGPVDGAWWPRSTDAGAELPGLIAAVDQRLDVMTLRVGLHIDAWDDIPRRIPAPGRAVRVGWFRSMDEQLVTLSINGKQGITLQVIPPDATQESAQAAFDRAVADPDGGRHLTARTATLEERDERRT
ncbi:DUF5994 family protein [Nonomuraea sp. LPB2021202275-12-8]|uniref:DUF5994 family protein n=1 Tax=Nonomuraea sp. LPB2021202275-12-8 TaxID=3120159 RepID=UPI00300DBAA1